LAGYKFLFYKGIQMGDILLDEKKTKICTICKQEKPIEDFYKTKCRGVEIRISMCTKCNRKYQKEFKAKSKEKRIQNRIPILEKTCNRCDVRKSVSEFTISNNTIDGFAFKCKECERDIVNRRKNRYLEKGYVADKKVCFSCKIEKNRSEYSRSRGRKDGLFHICKECARKINNVDGNKGTPTLKVCNVCGEIKSSDNFFVSKWSKDGLTARCKECLKVEREETKKKIHAKGFVAETKLCYTCKENKPSTDFRGNREVPDGLWFECKICAKTRRLNLIDERKKTRVVPDKKVCSTCNTEKPSKDFNNDIFSKDGLGFECKKCSLDRKDKNYKSKSEEEKQRIIQDSKIRANNYYKEHTNELKAYQQQYNKENKEKVSARARKNEQRRYKEDENYRIKKRLKARIRFVLKGETKAGPTLKLLGCDTTLLKTRFETLFKQLYPNYKGSKNCWTLFLEGKIQADHIVPCSSFDFTIKENQYKCFHYTNLQPLFIRDNLTKHERIDWSPKDILPYEHLTDDDIEKEYLFYIGKQNGVKERIHKNPQSLLDSFTSTPTVVPTLEGLKEAMENVYSVA
jgi:hypothetical protein